MIAFTLRYPAVPDDAEIGSVEMLARGHDARVTWRRNDAAPTYALVEGADSGLLDRLRERSAAAVWDFPIIALAVFPGRPEALSPLRDALGGAGRPAGVVGCEPLGDGVLVEWNPERSSPELVLDLIDVELARFGAGRRTELLAPLTLARWTQIAASGLRAPEIAPDRVLEALIEAAPCR